MSYKAKQQPGFLAILITFLAIGVTLAVLPMVLKGDALVDMLDQPAVMLEGLKLFYAGVGGALLALGVAYVIVDKQDPVKTQPGEE
ncbi:MAG: hypothetical protein VKJ06_09265 [Vampirovibrionales bacterium]|nr:hypothetical protein [Vampirovibrionales bacterium]